MSIDFGTWSKRSLHINPSAYCEYIRHSAAAMSYTHTPVSASVIKSTSRFVAKAVPRKQTVIPPRSTPAPVEDILSESEEGDNDEPLLDSLEDDSADQPEKLSSTNSASQSSIPPIIAPSSQALVPVPVSAPVPARSRSTAVTMPSIEPTATATTATTATDTTTTTATTTRKRQQQASRDDNARRLRRRTTPPTAEEVVISPSTMKMSEMCIDKRTGRKSSRYAELREAERQRKRLKELNKEQQERGESTDPGARATPVVEGVETVPEEDDSLQPVTFGTARVITDSEGNIVIDQSSLQVDRHAIHPSTLTDSLIQTTETMFTSKTNSSTYASTRTHASNTIRWLPSDNEKFYEALRMFGTDFQTIADYLGGGKDRRHIKNKFYKEEKKNSDKLTWALKNKLPPDVARLAENRGIVLNARDADQVREELAAFTDIGRVTDPTPIKS